MPYIEPSRRRIGYSEPAKNAGELNYMFSKIIDIYIKSKGKSYQTFNDILGALSGQSQEIYRRKIAPYEDRKCEVNGDVYEP